MEGQFKMKFLRRDSKRYSKFGKGRGKKAIWRKPTGRDNKMREKRKGYPVVVKIGYKQKQEKSPITISNIRDLEKLNKDDVGKVGNLGLKKKIEIAKKAIELKVKLINMNPKTFLKDKDKKGENKK